MRALSFLFVLVLTKPILPSDPVDYVRDIKPILKDRCYACHGVLAQKSDLRLDSGKEIQSVLIPKNAEDSVLIERIAESEADLRMPPEGLPLTREQITKIKSWIDAGAIYPAEDQPEKDPREHWAFRKPIRAPLPDVSIPAFNQNPIDRFIAAEWHKRKLIPQIATDQRMLLRRVYLDLTGLPPTQEEVREFLSDDRPDAYERLVDRLLSSPQYAERWARHFLDIWRYSDWWGLGAEVRNSQKHMWHWRDWAIDSFESDKGYDVMIREMLAGDELYPSDHERVRGTGYLARQYFRFNRNSWMDETVEHTSKAFLGLTWNCARCHDHKYDPISQVDYYRFRAFFEPYQVRAEMVPGETNFAKDGLPRVFDCNLNAPTYLFIRGDDKQPRKDKPISPGIPSFLISQELRIREINLPPESHSPQIQDFVLKNHIELARKESEHAVRAVVKRWEAERARVTGTPEEALKAARAAARAEKELENDRAARQVTKAEAELAKTLGIRRIGPAKRLAIAKANHEKTILQLKNPGETFTPLQGALKTPESNLENEASRMKPFPKISTGRRSALANWIASTDNPLTARVLVNHVWLRHFGQPLVLTVFDFGRKGQKPSHPELLDWLALEFMEQCWSIKHLHRLMVTSQMYRLSAKESDTQQAIDPENRYYWRRTSMRMDAPTIRDSLLLLAGELDPTKGGPAVPSAQQANSRRRSIYFFQSHNEHNKLLSIFDDANVLDCYRRTESIVPQQALALSNSAFALDRATAIAKQIDAKSNGEFIRRSFVWLLGWPPSAEEFQACNRAIDELHRLANGTDEQKRQSAYARLILALLNHNDFVTIR